MRQNTQKTTQKALVNSKTHLLKRNLG